VNFGYCAYPFTINFVGDSDAGTSTATASGGGFVGVEIPIGMIVQADVTCGEYLILVSGWEISGESYSSWSYDGETPQLLAVNPGHKISIRFYWTTPGIQTVKVKYDCDMFSSFQDTFQVSVVGPVVALTSKFNEVKLYVKPEKGIDVRVVLQAMEFTTQVTGLANFDGEIMGVQVITSEHFNIEFAASPLALEFTSKKLVVGKSQSHNRENLLDNRVPYGGNPPTPVPRGALATRKDRDVPNVHASNPLLIENQSDFKYYIMYRPAFEGAETHWVPIANIEWKFYFRFQFILGSAEIDRKDPSASGMKNGEISHQYPQWKGVQRNTNPQPPPVANPPHNLQPHNPQPHNSQPHSAQPSQVQTSTHTSSQFMPSSHTSSSAASSSAAPASHEGNRPPGSPRTKRPKTGPKTPPPNPEG